eukprot:11393711-Alexandrium_andersonii.AAC.1
MLDGHADGRPDSYGPDGLAWNWDRMFQQLTFLSRVGDLFSERRLQLAYEGLGTCWTNAVFSDCGFKRGQMERPPL